MKFKAEGRKFANILRSFNNLFKHWKVSTIFETFLTSSSRFLRSNTFEKLAFKLEKNNWDLDLETYRKSQNRSFVSFSKYAATFLDTETYAHSKVEGKIIILILILPLGLSIIFYFWCWGRQWKHWFRKNKSSTFYFHKSFLKSC